MGVSFDMSVGETGVVSEILQLFTFLTRPFNGPATT